MTAVTVTEYDKMLFVVTAICSQLVSYARRMIDGYRTQLAALALYMYSLLYIYTFSTVMMHE